MSAAGAKTCPVLHGFSARSRQQDRRPASADYPPRPPAPTRNARQSDRGGMLRQAVCLQREPPRLPPHTRPGGGGRGQSGSRQLELSPFPRETTISDEGDQEGYVGLTGWVLFGHTPLRHCVKILKNKFSKFDSIKRRDKSALKYKRELPGIGIGFIVTTTDYSPLQAIFQRALSMVPDCGIVHARISLSEVTGSPLAIWLG